MRQIDIFTVVAYVFTFLAYNIWHYAYVRAQLFFNDVMTDERELPVHGFALAQMGQMDESGLPSGKHEDGRLVYGKYADRPTAAQNHEVFSVLRLLVLSRGSMDEGKRRVRNELEASALDEFTRMDTNKDGECRAALLTADRALSSLCAFIALCPLIALCSHCSVLSPPAGVVTKEEYQAYQRRASRPSYERAANYQRLQA